MKYVYKEPVVSVPPPAGLIPSTPTDPLQELIHRRAEARKNRLLYHLTEADCKLICTNAQERKFTDGQVIATEGDAIKAIYRIKSGKISLMKSKVKLYDLPQGHFIGEGLFIRGDAPDAYGAALVANGPVVLSEVNLPFVRQLLDMDKILAFKIYRHIASKLSALLFTMVSKISFEPIAATLPRSDSLSSSSSEGSSISSNDSQSSLNSEPDLAYTPKGVVISQEVLHAALTTRKSKKQGKAANKDVAFKTYQLSEQNDGGTAVLFSRKLVFSNRCKITSKRKIKYNKILDMAKTGKTSVTIIYGVQARTVFFKDETELNEFYNIVQSLILTSEGGATQLPSSPSPISKSNNPLARSSSLDPEVIAADKHAFMQLAVRQDLVKGDVVVAEGDLYQRIYIVASGELRMKSGDRTLVTIKEGGVFGVITLFYLRPCNITIEVQSDTATLLIIPNYKIQELVTSNFPLAVRVYKKSAQLVYSQIERALTNRNGPVTGFSAPLM